MLSERIAHVIRLDEDYRHRIAEEAIRNARENFGKERMCSDTIGVYRELLDEDVATVAPPPRRAPTSRRRASSG